MIDTVIIHIPMFKTYTRKEGNVNMIIGDVADYGLVASTRYIVRDPITKEITHGDLYHPFESLPTSHSGVACKFFDRTANCLPYLSLNASVAKIEKGHNVYGHNFLYNSIADMLAVFKKAYPNFWQFLDVANAKISRLDITYSAKMQNKHSAEQMREYLRNVNFGRLRNNSKQERWNTIYFGSENSRVGGAKIYCKGAELRNERKELAKKANSGCLMSLQKLKVLTPKLQDIADKLIRFEATIKTRQLHQMSIPSNLWQFIDYVRKNPNTFIKLWKYKFDPILSTLKGMVMTNADDAKVREILYEKLTTVTKTGRISTTKAKNAFRFYRDLKIDGFINVQKNYSKSQFSLLVKTLVDCGFSRAFLQNLSKPTVNEAIPVLHMLNIDFGNNLPNDYQLNISENLFDFEEYLPKGLKLNPRLRLKVV
ncbi:MAG: phage/plasmid replication protein, II/X family [Flavobacteriaceae bacterium]|nr:phage/plasmid replication protein, II/X family [Flavobacteriaceae bacterium]